MSVYQLSASQSEIDPLAFDLDRDDPSLNGAKAHALSQHYQVDAVTLSALFLSAYGLEYVSAYFAHQAKPLRVLSFPEATNTCYEKAAILHHWNPLNVIKAFYLESSADGALYAVIVPETGCFLDRDVVRQQLGLPDGVVLGRANHLPAQMSFGSCSPFVKPSDLLGGGGRVARIVFDKETLVLKRHEDDLDDFSFGLDHRLSIQMNYYQCYRMLHRLYGDVVTDREVLSLSFKERLVRTKGRIKVDYEFRSLNYRTARFINEIHGYGDVDLINDHVDELFIPDVLTSQEGRAGGGAR